MRTMYATTYVDEFGRRNIADTNDVRHFAETREAAEASLAMTRAHNSPDRVKEYARGNDASLDVREIECYDNGHMVSIKFTSEDLDREREATARAAALDQAVMDNERPRDL